MKKIMTILATAMVALMLVGCAKFGDVQTSGTKWKKTFILDGTKASVGDNQYSRGFSALSSSKKCSEIETTITLPIGDDNIFEASGKRSVIGLAFDVHITTVQGKDYYDFVLVGVKPSDGEFYVEKYERISKDELKEDMITIDSAINGATEDNASGPSFTSLDGKSSGQNFVTSKKVNITTTAESKSFTISVTQTSKGVYVVKNGETTLGTYDRHDDLSSEETSAGKAYGQVFTYGNAPKGTKIKAVFESDKNKTVGLFADEEEW
jgi:hypothetical protein